MIIPFANPLGPSNGPNSDGCLHSGLTYASPDYAYTSSYAEPVGNVFRGNADDTGGVLYEDVTNALSSVGGSSTTLFDTVNPTADELWVEIAAGEDISGFGLYVSAAGVYTGAAACQVTYKSTAGTWVNADCVLDGTFDSIGMAYISFDKISAASMAIMDALIDPVNGAQSRRFLVKFSGISAVTTAPVVDMIFKMFPADGPAQLTDADAYCVDNVADIPIAYDTLSVFAHVGDRTMFAFSQRFALLKTTIERGRLTPDAKLVYSRADGTFGDLTVLSMTSDSLGRPDQWLTGDPGAYPDIIIPPDDWGVQSHDLGEGYLHTGYWVGIEYTAGSTQPELAFLAAIQGGMFSGADGVIASKTLAAATISINVRGVSDTDSVFVIANLSTGNSTILTLPANATSTEAGSSLAITAGDQIAIQQLSGSELSVPSDGFFSFN